MAPLALTRPVSRSIDRCQLTYLARGTIDIDLASRQHRAYEQALEAAGATVERLPAADDLPDAVFIEDTAVVLDEIAVITRPGAASRRSETVAVARRLADLRPLAVIEAPATLDGGDVLRVGRSLFVGRTARSNATGREALARICESFGYTMIPVDVHDCLHLKSAASWLGDETVLVDPAHVCPRDFEGLNILRSAPGETGAANVLKIGGLVLTAAAFPRTRRVLERAGFSCRVVENGELARAEGGLSCCSLIVDPVAY